MDTGSSTVRHPPFPAVTSTTATHISSATWPPATRITDRRNEELERAGVLTSGTLQYLIRLGRPGFIHSMCALAASFRANNHASSPGRNALGSRRLSISLESLRPSIDPAKDSAYLRNPSRVIVAR